MSGTYSKPPSMGFEAGISSVLDAYNNRDTKPEYKAVGPTGKRFKMEHLVFNEVDRDFPESNPPWWLVSNAFKWWWDGFVLKLDVGESIESDFQKITRIE